MNLLTHIGRSILIAGAAVSLLSGCGGGSGNSTDSATGSGNPLNGFWQAAGYGKIAWIDNTHITFYDYTQTSCLVNERLDDVDEEDFKRFFDLGSDGILALIEDGTPAFHAPSLRFQPIAGLPELCKTPSVQAGEAGYQQDWFSDYEIFWQTFSDYYLSFELKGVDWYSVRQQALANLQDSMTQAAFLDVLYQSVQPLKDGHIAITSSDGQEVSFENKPSFISTLVQEAMTQYNVAEPLSDADIETINTYVSEQLERSAEIITNYAESEVKSAANGNINWFKQGNIGYLEISGMQDFAAGDEFPASELAAIEQAMQTVLSDMSDTAGLIVDIRSNVGGNDYASMKLFSYFIQNEQLMFSKQARLGASKTALKEVRVLPANITYHQPIVLLTSNTTASAAEVFTVGMRALPNVTLIGESTQGEFSDALEKRLPSGIVFTLSNEFYYTPAGEWLEHQGVAVDIEVPYLDRAQRQAEEDLGIETAYALLTGQR